MFFFKALSSSRMAAFHSGTWIASWTELGDLCLIKIAENGIITWWKIFIGNKVVDVVLCTRSHIFSQSNWQVLIIRRQFSNRRFRSVTLGTFRVTCTRVGFLYWLKICSVLYSLLGSSLSRIDTKITVWDRGVLRTYWRRSWGFSGIIIKSTLRFCLWHWNLKDIILRH